MRRRFEKTRRTAAFTLLELVIVIAIMLVLATILLVAVNKAFSTAKVTSAANDIRQLELALENFKTQYGFYPPSRFKLCGNKMEYGTTALDTDSIGWLTRTFPKITTVNKDSSGNVVTATTSPWADPTTTAPGSGVPTRWAQWDGQYTSGAKPPPVILEGDQCLVFFLGGIPIPGNPIQMSGFSQTPIDPSAARQQQGEVRISFFDFGRYQGRLQFLSSTTSFSATGAAGFNRSAYSPSLLDVFSYNATDSSKWRPYLYFSSYKTADGYFRYTAAGALADTTYPQPPASASVDAWATASSDCPTFNPPYNPVVGAANLPQTVGIWPYVANANLISQAGGTDTFYVTFQNSNSFQILCAGKDGNFGSGTNTLNLLPNNANYQSHVWPPASSAYSALPADFAVTAWVDDLSNFSSTPMGVSK